MNYAQMWEKCNDLVNYEKLVKKSISALKYSAKIFLAKKTFQNIIYYLYKEKMVSNVFFFQVQKLVTNF